MSECVCAAGRGVLQIADLSFTLTEAEVEKGMVLTCMSRPVSDEVR